MSNPQDSKAKNEGCRGRLQRGLIECTGSARIPLIWLCGSYERKYILAVPVGNRRSVLSTKCFLNGAANKIPNKQTPRHQRINRHSVNFIGPLSREVVRYSRAGIVPLRPAVYGMPPIDEATVMTNTFSLGLNCRRRNRANGLNTA